MDKRVLTEAPTFAVGAFSLLSGNPAQSPYPPTVSVPTPRLFQYMERSTRFVNDGPPGVVAMARVRTPPRRDRPSSRCSRSTWGRVDSLILLPKRSRCLIRLLPTNL